MDNDTMIARAKYYDAISSMLHAIATACQKEFNDLTDDMNDDYAVSCTRVVVARARKLETRLTIVGGKI